MSEIIMSDFLIAIVTGISLIILADWLAPKLARYIDNHIDQIWRNRWLEMERRIDQSLRRIREGRVR
jgi:hypothetical protein